MVRIQNRNELVCNSVLNKRETIKKKSWPENIKPYGERIYLETKTLLQKRSKVEESGNRKLGLLEHTDTFNEGIDEE